ncbi:MAG: formylglycine-generating enzyme family protein [Planctomycetota bacterium]
MAALEQALSQPEQADLAVLREFRGVPWVDQLHAQRQNQSAGAILEHARRDYAAAIAPLSAPPVIEVAGIELRLVPAGRFRLGDEWQDGEADEQPSAAAEIARPFYLGTCEVTQAQWQAVMGENPSRGAHAANLPVDSVSLAGVATFLQKTGLRLPTEVEWEYAAKTGTGLKYAIGNLPEDLDRVAWHQQNSGGAAQPVATRAPNAWGFYDLLGNVHEWCATPYAPSPALAVQASQALASGGDPRPRALRGGSWSAAARALRVSARDRCEPTSTGGAIGVRAARDVD